MLSEGSGGDQIGITKSFKAKAVADKGHDQPAHSCNAQAHLPLWSGSGIAVKWGALMGALLP